MKLSARANSIEPFYVMEIAKAASALGVQMSGTDASMIYLNIGEPDFTAPPAVVAAAESALRRGATQYTPATGLHALRERISGWYLSHHGLSIDSERIVITAGASAALHLACLALVESGDEILMPDPSYPCNRNFVSAADGRAVLVPATAQQRFQLSADAVQQAWGERTRGVLLASPSNPTGTSIHPDEMRRIHDTVSLHGGVSLVDEIYLGLSYEKEFGHTALALDDQVISINSFSKYFSMTGWRLGWLVVPPGLVAPIERLAQSLFICPSAIAQQAALACFEADSLAEYERRRAEFKARRDYFIPALHALGLEVPVMPDGAFYAWADCRSACARLNDKFGTRIQGSWDFAFELMRRTHVAVAPGRDFGTAETGNFVRFSTASDMSQLKIAIGRLQSLLA
jgi:aspartate/methionine/tyrosine aminotransferase